jgi:hypothetical protein
VNKCSVTRLTPHLRPCYFYISRASLRLRPPPSILLSYFFDPAVNTKSWHLSDCPPPPSNSSSSLEFHDHFKSWHLTATPVHFRPGYLRPITPSFHLSFGRLNTMDFRTNRASRINPRLRAIWKVYPFPLTILCSLLLYSSNSWERRRQLLAFGPFGKYIHSL